MHDGARREGALRDLVIGRGLKALRQRKGWRQRDLALFSSISRSVISDLEAGDLEPHSVGALRRVVEAAGGNLRLELQVPHGDLSRLLDADHARLQSHWKARLERWGWNCDVEATFNHYGERGSVDLLAWHPPRGTLLVIEVKTVIVDVQALLATIDRKTRIAAGLAAARSWRTASVVPALFVLEGATARRTVARHAPLFARFELRGRRALSWLRDPRPDPSLGTRESRVPDGLLIFTKLSAARSGDRRQAGRQRLRLSSSGSRSGERLPTRDATSSAV